MTHPSHQTNGASLEDCHTNFFALVSELLWLCNVHPRLERTLTVTGCHMTTIFWDVHLFPLLSDYSLFEREKSFSTIDPFAYLLLLLLFFLLLQLLVPNYVHFILLLTLSLSFSLQCFLFIYRLLSCVLLFTAVISYIHICIYVCIHGCVSARVCVCLLSHAHRQQLICTCKMHKCNNIAVSICLFFLEWWMLIWVFYISFVVSPAD